MATGTTALAVEEKAVAETLLKTLLGRYFYLCMSLALAALVLGGFSRTAGTNLFHANPPRPALLWIHGAAFSTWIVFFILQSALVRVREVSVHRFLGWLGAGLAALMVVLGLRIAVVMARFNTVVLHHRGEDTFLAVPFCDMMLFACWIAMAIYWRRKPDYHRRFVFVATSGLMDAPIGRFDFWFSQSLFYPCVDVLIVLGMVRDWVVDGRVHKVYLCALPLLIIAQNLAMYMWRVDPAWWQGITHTILGW